jgi:hypothetical protein
VRGRCAKGSGQKRFCRRCDRAAARIVKGHPIQLIRFPQAEMAARDAIRACCVYGANSSPTSCRSLSTACAKGSCRSANEVSVGAESGAPARCLNGSLVAESIAMLPASFAVTSDARTSPTFCPLPGQRSHGRIRRHCKVVAQFRSVEVRPTSLPPLLYVASKGLASRPGSSRRTAAEEGRTYGATRMGVSWSTCGVGAAEGAAGVWR